MAIFTYIAIWLIVIGFILIGISERFRFKSIWNLPVIGAWLIILVTGTLSFTWFIYGLYHLYQFLVSNVF